VSDAAWMAEHTRESPPGLRARAAEYLEQVAPGGILPARLASAANLALISVLGQGRDRAAALDLLTADTLLTLALLAQAETAPGDLGRFASDFVSTASA